MFSVKAEEKESEIIKKCSQRSEEKISMERNKWV